MQELVRKSLELTPAQWRRLDEIAAELDTTAPTGSNAGKTSWRTLIKEVSNGTLNISRNDSTQ